MNCKVCGASIAPITIKDGAICNNCFSGLPRCAQTSISKISAANIKKIKKICHSGAIPAVITYNQNLSICDTGVIFSGCYFPFENIKKAEAVFHPQRPMWDNFFSGTITLKLKTSNNIIIEDIIAENANAILKDARKTDFYIGSPFLEKTVILIAECSKYNKKAYEQRFYDELVERTMKAREFEHRRAEEEHRKAEEREQKRKWREAYERRWEEEWRQKDKNARQDSKSQSKGSYRQSEYGRSGSSSQQESGNRQQASHTLTYEEALIFFGLQAGYTKEDLRKHRNLLMKLYHPDGGGSEEMSKKVNECYTLLAGCIS